RGESDLTPVLVRSNSAWILELRGTQEYAEGTAGELSLDRLSARVDAAATDGTWLTHLPHFQHLLTTPTMIASGIGPRPFAISEALIPVQFAGEVPLTVPCGSYRFGVEVTVEAAQE
ncbi:MAG: hypothetical protein ABH877_02965, partial [bacterium]